MRSATISLALWKKIANLILAQFRTCLWPCVDRRVSGQEAGQPPKEGTYLPCISDRQLEAKPAIPALNGGRGLKQRRKGFFGYCRRKCRGHRRGLSIFANSAERDLPYPDLGSNHGDVASRISRDQASQQVHLARRHHAAGDGLREHYRDDRTHS